MTKYRWGFEGVANGTAFTTGNLVSTSPTGLSASTVSNGTGSNASDNTYVHTGLASIKVTVPTTSSQAYRLPFAATNNAAAVSFYHWMAAAPAGNFTLLTGRYASGIAYRVILNSANKVLLADSPGTTTIGTSTASITYNQWNRFEVVANASTGNITLNVYSGDGTSVVATVSGTGASLGASPLASVDIGSPASNGTGSVITQWFDDVQLDDGATVEIGPYVPTNNVPNLTLTANQNVAASAAVTATAIASDSDGTITSYSWSVFYSSTTTPTLSGSSTATVSLTAPSTTGELVILRCIVTDNGGATTTAYTEVRVLKSGAFTTLPIVGTGVGSWTNNGGATSEGAALADASNSTYLESPDYSVTEITKRLRLQPLSTRSTLTLTPTSAVTGTGGTTKFRLYEGSTLRQEWLLEQDTIPTDRQKTVSNPELITDWGDLYVEWSAVT